MSDSGTIAKVDVVNLLKFGWEVVKDSQPVLNIDADRANAVPQGSNWMSDLQGSQGPNEIPFSFRIRNDFIYESWPVVCDGFVKWTFGSRYRGGGAFIPNAWIEITHCEVSGPTRRLDVNVQVGNPENRGSDTAPNAFLPLTVSFQFQNLAKDITRQYSYYLYGSGHYEQ